MTTTTTAPAGGPLAAFSTPIRSTSDAFARLLAARALADVPALRKDDAAAAWCGERETEAEQHLAAHPIDTAATAAGMLRLVADAIDSGLADGRELLMLARVAEFIEGASRADALAVQAALRAEREAPTTPLNVAFADHLLAEVQAGRVHDEHRAAMIRIAEWTRRGGDVAALVAALETTQGK